MWGGGGARVLLRDSHAQESRERKMVWPGRTSTFRMECWVVCWKCRAPAQEGCWAEPWWIRELSGSVAGELTEGEKEMEWKPVGCYECFLHTLQPPGSGLSSSIFCAWNPRFPSASLRKPSLNHLIDRIPTVNLCPTTTCVAAHWVSHDWVPPAKPPSSLSSTQPSPHLTECSFTHTATLPSLPSLREKNWVILIPSTPSLVLTLGFKLDSQGLRKWQ